ncbi:MAG: CRISPR-associated endonuclease Cas2 [Candidatus Aminicenantes bacterium]|nr:CRISPR-associated endonuclease Cas2 [Candidatus Aminicenantes bacterium]
MELNTYVIYDIEDDRIRYRISEICKDYGLERIQYSAFFGLLSKNRREELFLKLSRIIKNKKGKIIIQPVCEKDAKEVKIIINELENQHRINDDET